MTVTCPEGHRSEATDYCDTCGAPIGAASPGTAAASGLGAAGAPSPGGPALPGQAGALAGGSVLDLDPAGPIPTVTCPHCGGINLEDALFCEACGYDFTTGAAPLDDEPGEPGASVEPGEPEEDESEPVQGEAEPVEDEDEDEVEPEVEEEQVVPGAEGFEKAGEPGLTVDEPAEVGPAEPPESDESPESAERDESPQSPEPDESPQSPEPGTFTEPENQGAGANQGDADPIEDPGDAEAVVDPVTVGEQGPSEGVEVSAQPEGGPVDLRRSESSAPAEPAKSEPVELAPEAPPAHARPRHTPPSRDLADAWVVEMWVDPDWYEVQQTDEACPSAGVPDIVVVRRNVVLIGRPSGSLGVRPDVDAGADSAVSRRHAQLTSDGTRWWIEDLGSSNGTFVGVIGDPLPTEALSPGQRVEIDRDDRIYVGAWTRLVVRQATESEKAGQG